MCNVFPTAGVSIWVHTASMRNGRAWTAARSMPLSLPRTGPPCTTAIASISRQSGCADAFCRSSMPKQVSIPEQVLLALEDACRTRPLPLVQDTAQHDGANERSAEDPERQQEQPLPYSDYSNARALIHQYGQDMHYSYPWRCWLVWTGTHWARDTGGVVMGHAKSTIKRLARQMEALDDATAAKAL